MKNVVKALKVISISFIVTLISVMPIAAAETTPSKVNITLEQYTPSGGWKPGDENEIGITIDNTTSDKIKVETISINMRIPQNLEDEMLKKFNHKQDNIKLILKYKGEVISDSSVSLKQLLESKKIVLSKKVDIGRNGTEELTMDILMDEDMDNRTQSLESIYSFEIGYRTINDGEIIPSEPLPPEESLPPSKPQPPDEELPEDPLLPSNPQPPVTSPEEKPSNPDTEVGGSGDKLPQTGGIINGASLGVLGASLVGAGVIMEKKLFKIGGKADE